MNFLSKIDEITQKSAYFLCKNRSLKYNCISIIFIIYPILFLLFVHLTPFSSQEHNVKVVSFHVALQNYGKFE